MEGGQSVPLTRAIVRLNIDRRKNKNRLTSGWLWKAANSCRLARELALPVSPP